MKILINSMVLLFLFILGGCAAPGPVFEPLAMNENTSTVYIYRPSKFAGGGTYPHVYLNGIEQGPLRNGGYLAFHIDPGIHKIEAKGKDWKWDIPDKAVSIKAGVGESYYIKLGYSSGVGVSNSGNDNSQRMWQGSLWVLNYGAGFEPVEPSIAVEEIKKLKLSM